MPTTETFQNVPFTRGRGGQLWGWFHDGERKRLMTLEEAKKVAAPKKAKKKAKKEAANV